MPADLGNGRSSSQMFKMFVLATVPGGIPGASSRSVLALLSPFSPEPSYIF